MQNNFYYTSPAADNKLTIHNQYNNNTICTHCDSNYPPLSQHTALLLCDDINEVHTKNADEISSDEIHESLLKSMCDLYLGDELRESLGYCLLSTFIERKSSENTELYTLQIEPVIHWDRLFRLSPQPEHQIYEAAIVTQIKSSIYSSWADLPHNYCSSAEEMEHEGIDFINQEIIKELTEITSDFDQLDIFCVDLLFQFTEQFSITLPILWVAGKISNEDFVNIFSVFVHNEPAIAMLPEQRAYRKHLAERLKYLMAIKKSIVLNELDLFGGTR
jgi:hypothetical protein